MNKKPQVSPKNIYQVIWRWHLYAGLLLAPILLILAVTGGIYLFKGNLEATLYSEYMEINPDPSGITLSPSELLAEVTQTYENASLLSYKPNEAENQSVEVGLLFADGSIGTVFVNPYSGEELGMLFDNERIMNWLIDLHSELLAGTFGDRVVELAASWTLLLIVSGLYLWWPRKPKIAGVWIPRFKKGKRILARDLHAIPAAWLSVGLAFFILTGLLWTGFWGNGVQQIATKIGLGYPPSIWVGDAPQSLTEDVAESSWAAQKLPVPPSKPLEGYEQVSIDHLVTTAIDRDLHPSYTVYFPKSETGAFTLSAFPEKAADEATMYVDQYTGAVLTDYRYADYGLVGKAMATGITIHKGLEFGIANQMIGLIICIGLIGIIVSGFSLWLRRKPKGHLAAPKAISIRQIRMLVLLLIVFALLFPLVAVSLIVVFLFDFFIVQKNDRLRKFFQA